MANVSLRNANRHAAWRLTGAVLTAAWDRLVRRLLGSAADLPNLDRDRAPGTVSPFAAVLHTRDTPRAFLVIDGGRDGLSPQARVGARLTLVWSSAAMGRADRAMSATPMA